MQILIFARADSLRNGLQTLLSVLASPDELHVVDDLAHLAAGLETRQIDLVFLYPNLPFEELLAASRQMRELQPRAYRVVVTEGPNQTKLALEAGADQVILKGFTAAQLMQIVLMSKNEAAMGLAGDNPSIRPGLDPAK